VRQPTLVLIFGIVSAVAIGAADYATGHELSLGIFYLIPIAYVTWIAGLRPGIFVAICSAVAWLLAELLGGYRYSQTFIPYWNSATRLGIFGLTAILVARSRVVAELLRSEATRKTADLQNANALLQREIEERRRTEGRIRLLARALESASNAILITDPGGHILWVNPSFTTLTGYSADESVGRNPRFLKSGAHPPAFYQQLWATILQGAVWQGEITNRRKDGTLYTADVRISPVQEEGDGLGHFIAVHQDITERKQAEEELRASEARYRSLFENAPISLWEEDLSAAKDYVDGLRATGVTEFERYFAEHPKALAHCVDLVKVLDVNQTTLKVFDAPDKPSLLKGLGEIFTEESYPAFQQKLVALSQGVSSRFGQTVRRTLKGELRHLAVHWQVVPGHEKKFDRVLVSALDMTEARQLEERLRRAQKMEAVGRLAGGVAHDFNNLLGVIIGYAELLAERVGPQEPMHHQIEEIHKAGRRGASLTKQLLAFSRQLVLEPRVLNLNEAVKGISRMLERLIGEDIDLAILLDPALEQVKADPGQLEQVIMNLAVNARDAMPEGGKLTIETANVDLDEGYAHQHYPVVPGRYVMLAVTDTGVGMDKQTQAHIFEPFFSTKEKGKGTGLGLATVYGIVKQSKGYVWAYSEPGQGTTFKIYLPRVRDAAAPLREAEPPAIGDWHGETILVVEDEEPMREMISECLRTIGCRVLIAGHGEEALRAAEEHPGPIHLLLTDVVMPKLSGRELALRLKQHRKEMKVVFMSGYTDEAMVRQGMLETGAVFLQKPFTPRQLLHKLRRALDSRHQ